MWTPQRLRGRADADHRIRVCSHQGGCVPRCPCACWSRRCQPVGLLAAGAGRDHDDGVDEQILRQRLSGAHAANVKRMLAYSSIGHAGSCSSPIVPAATLSHRAFCLFYLAVYSATTVGAFAVVAVPGSARLNAPVTLDSIRGWGFSRPLLRSVAAAVVLSLAGFPPRTGQLPGQALRVSAARSMQARHVPRGGLRRNVGHLARVLLRIGLALFDRRSKSPRDAARRAGLVSATVGAGGPRSRRRAVAQRGPVGGLDWAREAATTIVKTGRPVVWPRPARWADSGLSLRR